MKKYQIQFPNSASVQEYDTMLEAMKDIRVFAIEVIGSLTWIGEECDRCYGAPLTPDQFIALGKELKAVGEKMKETIAGEG